MRPLRLILVCVLLGAVTTVGVAWGCWKWLNPPRSSAGYTEYNGDLWVVDEFAGCGSRAFVMLRSDGTWSGMEEWLTSRPFIQPPKWILDSAVGTDSAWGRQTGWGLPAMYRFTSDLDDVARVHDQLPVHILPLGFAVDTAFFGTIWFGLIVCPGIVRRGLCPSCAYNLQGVDSGTCPECGNQIENGPDQSQDHGQD